MGLLSIIFGTSKPRSDPDPDTRSRVAASMSVAETTRSDDASMDLVLPRRRADVPEWLPPPRRPAPARAHAEALVALFQAEGRTGSVPHWELTSSYPELAWVQGFVQLSERQLLQGLSQVCAKVRRNVDVDGTTLSRVVHYVIPAPAWATSTDNVVTMERVNHVNMRPATRSKQGRNSTHALKSKRKSFASNPQILGQGKGGKYSADIGMAAALG